MPDWEFWIDVGGTFTDCLARSPDGSIRAHKLLSSGVYRGRVGSGSDASVVLVPDRRDDPNRFFDGCRLTLIDPATGRAACPPVNIERFDSDGLQLKLARPLAVHPQPDWIYELSSGEEAPIMGIRWLLGKRLDEPIGRVTIKLGTTRGTNALLERQGAPTALLTTKGFADVLRIAYQNRPKLFDLSIRKPTGLYDAVVEVDERIASGGDVLVPLKEAGVRRALEQLKDQGIVALAICLMNSYRNPAHEERIASIAGKVGFEQVSVSYAISPLQRIVPRGDTTVVDAYLTPIIKAYVAGIRAKVPQATLKLMTSAGGLVDAESFVGKDSILSGPAGGVVGVAQVTREAGFNTAIGFDMGGTSTDVCRYRGEFERRYVMEVNDPESDTGVRIVAPMLSIETVAAGGGSICGFDGQKPIVGPRSAGSNPGPACYGRGGPLCVTDVNLYLGRILDRHFAFPLDRAAVERRLGELCDEIERATGQRYAPERLALGFVEIANANMSAAIKKVSVLRGYDVRNDVLVSFGGAGAQHACAIARELGIRRILQHPYAGLLSAYGIGLADVRKFASWDVGEAYSPALLEKLDPIFVSLEADLRQQVLDEGLEAKNILAPRRLLDLRYSGQDSTITVAQPEDGDFASAFESSHKALYGFTYPGRTVEVFAARLEIVGETPKPRPARMESRPRRPDPAEWTESYFAEGWKRTGVYLRADLWPGDVIEGPAIIAEPSSTVVLEPGWRAVLTPRNDFEIVDLIGKPESVSIGSGVDAVALELFNNQFASIAEQMGVTLQRTALSTNVKERLDFSCAIFTPAGDLVVNAPHIPVHLGAMGETVKRVIADAGKLAPGEVYITNDPYRGGSHLPDVTVVTPVFEPGAAADRRIRFFTASRAHHAEIGGVVPGSMPPFSKSLAEEGVLIRLFRLVQNERTSENALRDLLLAGLYPTRAVEENIADINAQAAANQTGVALLEQLIERYGIETVQAYMGHIQKAAENKMRAALGRIDEGEHFFADQLDNGSTLAVKISVRHDHQGGTARVDFTGTDPVMESNLNANRAIVRAAVLYSFRCLIDDEIPLNDGVLAPIEIVVPEGCLLNPPAHDDPARCAAVVGGNVETSQRIVDVVLGALGVAAASQGPRTNCGVGRSAGDGQKGFGYYETIGGGAGAGPGFHGASAVHSHMTNTRLTDPEVIEDRYPVRLKQFAIRRGSGGSGQFRGGDGIVREIEFLAPLDVSILSNRRTTQPYGKAGGCAGESGRNLLIEKGSREPLVLEPAVQLRVAPGDVVRIETPGGGGWGEPQ